MGENLVCALIGEIYHSLVFTRTVLAWPLHLPEVLLLMRHCGRCKSLAWPGTCSAIPSLWQLEALPSYPNPEVNSLADLEKVLRIRLQTGAPGPSGQVDPDGVGIFVANLPLCCGGNPGGSFEVHPFHLIAQSAPWHFADHARALCGRDRWQSGEPARAVGPEQDASSGPCTEAFQRGARRHVLAQLEQKAVEGEDSQAREEEQDDEEQQGGSCYVFSVFGGIYPFRARFDENSIAGAHVKLGADGHGGREYLRCVELRGLDEGRDKLKVVLENCLAGLPVYLVSMVSQSDPVVKWLLQQGTVCLGEATAWRPCIRWALPLWLHCAVQTGCASVSPGVGVIVIDDSLQQVKPLSWKWKGDKGQHAVVVVVVVVLLLQFWSSMDPFSMAGASSVFPSASSLTTGVRIWILTAVRAGRCERCQRRWGWFRFNCMIWVVPPPSKANEGLYNSPGGDCYWAGGQPKAWWCCEDGVVLSI